MISPLVRKIINLLLANNRFRNIYFRVHMVSGSVSDPGAFLGLYLSHYIDFNIERKKFKIDVINSKPGRIQIRVDVRGSVPAFS